MTDYIKFFNLYDCGERDIDYIYIKLLTYRNLLGLYLCNSEKTKIGGVLEIKPEKGVNWVNTVIDNKGVISDCSILIKPLHIMFAVPPHHAALVIYDNNAKTFEYFDPNGVQPWYSSVYNAIESYNRSFMKGYRPKEQICVYEPQLIDNRGSCADWALFTLFMTCNNLDFLGLKGKIMRKTTDELRKLINGFRCYLWDVVVQTNMIDLITHIEMLSKILRKRPEEFFYLKENVYQLVADKKVQEAIELTGSIIERDDKDYKSKVLSSRPFLLNVDPNKRLIDILVK